MTTDLNLLKEKNLTQKLAKLQAEHQELVKFSEYFNNQIQEKGREWIKREETTPDDFIKMCVLVETAAIWVSISTSNLKDWMKKNGETLKSSTVSFVSVDNVSESTNSSVVDWMNKQEETQKSQYIPYVSPHDNQYSPVGAASGLANPTLTAFEARLARIESRIIETTSRERSRGLQRERKFPSTTENNFYETLEYIKAKQIDPLVYQLVALELRDKLQEGSLRCDPPLSQQQAQHWADLSTSVEATEDLEFPKLRALERRLVGVESRLSDANFGNRSRSVHRERTVNGTSEERQRHEHFYDTLDDVKAKRREYFLEKKSQSTSALPNQRVHFSANQAPSGGEMIIDPERASSEDLPDGYKDPALRDAVKSCSKCICRLKVTYVSKDRPRTFLDRNVPYPFYSKRGETGLRVGSGCVFDVEKVEQPCVCEECRKCKQSQRPHRYWKVYIRTVTHHVYDKRESKHSVFEMDVDGSTVTYAGLIWEDVFEPVQRDMACLYFPTHHSRLGEALKFMIQESNRSVSSMNAKFATQGPGGLAMISCQPNASNEIRVIMGRTLGWDEKTIHGRKCFRLRFSCAAYEGNYSGARVWPLGYRTPANGHYVVHVLPFSGSVAGEDITGWVEAL